MTQITQKKKERRAPSISKPGIPITNSLPKIENKLNLRNHITEKG